MSMDQGGQWSWGGCTLFCPWIRAVSVPYFGRGSGEVDHHEKTTLLTLVWSRSTHLTLYCLYYMYRVFWLAEKGSIWTKRDTKFWRDEKTFEFTYFSVKTMRGRERKKKSSKLLLHFLFVLAWNVQKKKFGGYENLKKKKKCFLQKSYFYLKCVPNFFWAKWFFLIRATPLKKCEFL